VIIHTETPQVKNYNSWT